MDCVLIEKKKIDIHTLQQDFLKSHQSSQQYGAFLSYAGLVRLEKHAECTSSDEMIAAIEYEMYHALFVDATLNFIEETRECLRRNLGPVTIIHREDVVLVGEPTIVIFLLATHHEDALEAMRTLLTGIRGKIPFWKKIIRRNGTHNFQRVL